MKRRRTNAQKAATRRMVASNKRRARGGRRRSNPTRRARSQRRTVRRRRRRSNPQMPVVLVNPRRKTTRRRNNPSRRRVVRRRRRRNASMVRRLPNPSTSWGGALLTFGIGMLGGGIVAGVDWGADFIPGPAWGQGAAVLGAGALTSVLLSRYADVRLGASIAGATTFALIGRAREMIALSGLGEEKTNGNGNGNGDSAAVIRARARDAGQVRARVQPQTMRTSAVPGQQTFKQQAEAGASFYMTPGQRRYGPQSWIYQPGAGAVYVSSHNSR